jgi:pSer/pThr/pTyr-binding forkhead associated (FHA) protein
MDIIRVMNSKRDPRDSLARVETLAEQLVEGSFARLFGQRLHPREVAMRLARAVEDNLRTEDTTEQLVAPSAYWLHLNADDYDALLIATPNLAQQLAESVIDIANRLGARLDMLPVVQIEPDQTLAPRALQIEAQWAESEARSTQVLAAFQPDVNDTPVPNRHPQLIVHGQVHIPLDRTVMNIGRRQTNHIVIDDNRVSRAHSQLRLRFGRYVLYDLGSTGGTFVNGQRISEWILRHGDVISLAGATLVYVEDESAVIVLPNASTDTQIQSPFKKSATESDPTRQPPL